MRSTPRLSAWSTVHAESLLRALAHLRPDEQARVLARYAALLYAGRKDARGWAEELRDDLGREGWDAPERFSWERPPPRHPPRRDCPIERRYEVKRYARLEDETPISVEMETGPCQVPLFGDNVVCKSCRDRWGNEANTITERGLEQLRAIEEVTSR